MKIFKTNVELSHFQPISKGDSGDLDFVFGSRDDCRRRDVSQSGHHYVFVSYKHYLSKEGRRRPKDLISANDVERMADLLDIPPEQLRLTSDREIECEEVKKNWWPGMVKYHKKICAMFLTKRGKTQDHMLKFWFIAELLAAKEAGCMIIAGKEMVTIVKNILEYVPNLSALIRLVERGSVIDNSQAEGEIITPQSMSGATITMLEGLETSERDKPLLGSLKEAPCFERQIREGIGKGPLVAIRSHVAGVTSMEHLLFREQNTPNLYVKPDPSLCFMYMGYEHVFISVPISHLKNGEYLRFDSDTALSSRFADPGTLGIIGNLSVCLIGDLAARVFNTGSIDGTVWVSMVYWGGIPHIKVDTVSVNFNDPHDNEVNRYFLGDIQAPRTARAFSSVKEMSYFDIVCLSRAGLNLRGPTYDRAVSALVKGKTAELSSVLGKAVQIGSFSGGITSLYNEGRVACILAFLSLRPLLLEEIERNAKRSSGAHEKGSSEKVRSLWFERGLWLIDHGRSPVECFIVAAVGLVIISAIVFISFKSDMSVDRKIEVCLVVIAALITLLVEGGSLVTGERVDISRVITGRRAITSQTGGEYLNVKLDVDRSKKNQVKLSDIRKVMSYSKASIFGECTGRASLQSSLTLKELAILGFEFGIDCDNRVVAQHDEMEPGTIMVITKLEKGKLQAHIGEGQLMEKKPMMNAMENYVMVVGH